MCCTSPCGENDIYYLLRVIGALAVFHLTTNSTEFWLGLTSSNLAKFWSNLIKVD